MNFMLLGTQSSALTTVERFDVVDRSLRLVSAPVPWHHAHPPTGLVASPLPAFVCHLL